MMDKSTERQVGKRIVRRATPEEAARHQLIREQIERELSTIQQLVAPHLIVKVGRFG